MVEQEIRPQTSVLLLNFNRLSLTFSPFDRIRAAKPKKPFIAGNGVREDQPEEADTFGALAFLIRAKKPVGKLLIAYNFFPPAKSHLSSTFCLCFSVTPITRLSDSRNSGLLRCGHDQVFERISMDVARNGPVCPVEFNSKKMNPVGLRLSHLRRRILAGRPSS